MSERGWKAENLGRASSDIRFGQTRNLGGTRCALTSAEHHGGRTHSRGKQKRLLFSVFEGCESCTTVVHFVVIRTSAEGLPRARKPLHDERVRHCGSQQAREPVPELPGMCSTVVVSKIKSYFLEAMEALARKEPQLLSTVAAKTY